MNKSDLINKIKTLQKKEDHMLEIQQELSELNQKMKVLKTEEEEIHEDVVSTMIAEGKEEIIVSIEGKLYGISINKENRFFSIHELEVISDK